MLYREANQYIEDFYRTSKNALLLTGARQTGKNMIMFIKPVESNIGVYKLDLSGLI